MESTNDICTNNLRRTLQFSVYRLKHDFQFTTKVYIYIGKSWAAQNKKQIARGNK